MSGWLSRFWRGARRIDQPVPVRQRDSDAELAELVALIESGDTSPEALERMATLMGQSDSGLG